MWTCPKCERQFRGTNQSHMCVEHTIDDLFADVPDHLVLAFDAIFSVVMTWKPTTAGASAKSVVFTNERAWLIIRPMSKTLDVKFYNKEPVDSDAFKKIAEWKGTYAHHLRISDESEVTDEVFELLRIGWNYGMGR